MCTLMNNHFLANIPSYVLMKLMSVDNECQKYTFNGFNKCEVLFN